MKKVIKILLAILGILGFLTGHALTLIPDLKWLSFVVFPLVGGIVLYFTLGWEIIKSVKDKSLYEKTYNDFFDGFAYKNEKIHGINKFMRFIERALFAASAVSAVYIVYILVANTSDRLSVVCGALIFVIVSGLAIHFHDANKLISAIGRKNGGALLGEWELKRIKIFGRIGRYSHLLAFGGFLVYLFLVAIRMPIFLMMAPLIPFWAYLTVYLGYGALYTAMTDYVLGTRKQFHCRS